MSLEYSDPSIFLARLDVTLEGSEVGAKSEARRVVFPDQNAEESEAV